MNFDCWVLVLALIICVQAAVNIASDDYLLSKYNLTMGPRPNETGRFKYESSLGSTELCKFCDKKTFVDSSYSHLQQNLCIANYGGKDISEQVTQKEKANGLYALCGSGEVPGCGLPPSGSQTELMHWYCDQGYSWKNYSVYFSCALICSHTDTVFSSYYCNEKLEWEIGITGQKCKAAAPPPEELKDNVNWGLIIGLVAGLVGAAVVALSVCIICRFLKRHKSLNVPNGDVPHANPNTNSEAYQALIAQQNPIPEKICEDGARISGSNVKAVRIFGHQQNSGHHALRPKNTNQEREVQLQIQVEEHISPSSKDSSTSTGYMSEQNDDSDRPLLNEVSAGTQTDDSVFSDDSGAVGGATAAETGSTTSDNMCVKATGPTEDNSDVGIRVVYWEDLGGKKELSVPLQCGFYSIEKGRNFTIIPTSSRGLAVTDFKIHKKESRQFRGKKEPGSMWYTISNAVKEDAGLYRWTILLAANVSHDGSFEIAIAYPDPLRRQPPVGEESPTPKTVVPHQNISSSRSRHQQTQLPNGDCPVRIASVVRAEVHQHLDPLQNAPVLNPSTFSGAHDSGLVLRGLGGSCSDSYHSGNSGNPGISLNQNMGNPRRPLDDRFTSTSGYRSQSSRGYALDRFESINDGVPPLNPNSMQSANVTRHGTEAESIVPNSYPVQQVFGTYLGVNDWLRRPGLEEPEELAESERPEPTGHWVPVSHRETQQDTEYHQTELKQPYIASRTEALLVNNESENEELDGFDERITSVQISRPPIFEYSEQAVHQPMYEDQNGAHVFSENSQLLGDVDALNRSGVEYLHNSAPHGEVERSLESVTMTEGDTTCDAPRNITKEQNKRQTWSKFVGHNNSAQAVAEMASAVERLTYVPNGDTAKLGDTVGGNFVAKNGVLTKQLRPNSKLCSEGEMKPVNSNMLLNNHESYTDNLVNEAMNSTLLHTGIDLSNSEVLNEQGDSYNNSLSLNSMAGSDLSSIGSDEEESKLK